MPVGQPLTAVWLYDNTASAYVDDTVEAGSDGGTAFNTLGDTDDFHYFGFSRRHDALMFVMSATATYGALTWSYGNTASSWITIQSVFNYDFVASSGYWLWDVRDALDTPWLSFALTTSLPHSSVSSVPDDTARFWIRVTSAVSVTSVGTINSVVCRPYNTYATAENVRNQLQLSAAFSTTTLPTLETIEDYLRGAEDELIYSMGESWRVEFEEEESIDFNQYGMKVRYEPIVSLYELAVWDGSNYDVKTINRDQDFHIIPRTGMIYVSTIFLDAIPPIFRRSYSARRDQGAFKSAVRVRYSHGHDFRRHRFSRTLNRITTYKACMDFITNEDFSALIPLGLDTISLQQKYENWKTDYTEFVDKYTKTRLF